MKRSGFVGINSVVSAATAVLCCAVLCCAACCCNPFWSIVVSLCYYFWYNFRIQKLPAGLLLPGHAVNNINADEQKSGNKPRLISHWCCVAGNW